MTDVFHPDIFIGETSREEMHFPGNWLLGYWFGSRSKGPALSGSRQSAEKVPNHFSGKSTNQELETSERVKCQRFGYLLVASFEWEF